MVYKLIIGNNFINNNPKAVYLFDRKIFSIERENDIPYISCKIIDDMNNIILEVEKNNILFNKNIMDIKKYRRDHILVLNKNGEIVLESRIVDKSILIVSGIFPSENFTCTITQNYILLSSGKRIMHSRIDSNNGNISISNEGINHFND
ncbi:MAG: hypothetical protein ACE5SW_07980 [Nitrososphaeraceae archaeon]